MIGELAHDALVLRVGLVGLALLAVAFAQAEDRGGGQLAVVVEMFDRLLVVADGGVQLVIGLLLEKAALHQGGDVVGRGGGEAGGGEEGESCQNKFRFHGASVREWRLAVVMLL